MFTLKLKRAASKLFEAQMVRSQLDHMNCECEDLLTLIEEQERTIKHEVKILSSQFHNENDHYGEWACHACGGDDEYPCDHCHDARVMTVDDVVESVVR